jgi:phosphotriesterase-related protein
MVIRTILEDLAPGDLGITSMHEHLIVDASVYLTARTERGKQFRDQKVSAENISDVRWQALAFVDNLILDSPEVMDRELSAFKVAGGAAIVDMTSFNVNPRALARISADTGVRVILGVGHYIHPTHTAWVCEASVDEIAERFETQVAEGVDGSGVQPGTFGEIGMSAPPEPCERRVLQAAARVASRHGMSVHIHVGNAGKHGLEHIADCAAEGLDPRRVVCGHMDDTRGVLDRSYHQAIMREGANIGLDTFGSELSYSKDFLCPSDNERIDQLVQHLDDGYADQIILGHDVCFKAHLHAFGGNGFDHLLARIAPVLMEERGISQDTLTKLLVETPRRLLSSSPPARLTVAPTEPLT